MAVDDDLDEFYFDCVTCIAGIHYLPGHGLCPCCGKDIPAEEAEEAES